MSFVAAEQLTVRLRAAAVVAYPAGATFGPRTLHDFELVWILRGSARWTCDEVTERIEPGELLLIHPGMRDFFAWAPDRTTEHAYAHFTVTGPVDSVWPVRSTLEPDDPRTGLLRYVLWLADATPQRWTERAEEALRLLLAVHSSGPLPDGDQVGPLPPAVEALASWLRERWLTGPTRPATLAELAAAGSVSTVHLSRLFRARFGVGPVAAVELLRLGRAESLLVRSNLSMAAIGAECGFADPYHFSRRFRAVYHVAPREFRAAAGFSAMPSPMVRAGLRPLARLIWMVA